MGPTEPLGYQLYGRAPAKAITKSLHCFTHFLRHSDGSRGTVIMAMEVSCITYTTKGKQKKAKERSVKQTNFSIKCTWMAPHGQISEGITPHLGITITCHSRNPGVRLAIFSPLLPAVPMKQFRVWERQMHGYDGMVFVGSTWYITRFLWYAVQKQ